MRSSPRTLVGQPCGPTTAQLLEQVQQALMELSVMSAALRDFAGWQTRADRVTVDPAMLRNYFHYQQMRSDGALGALNSVIHPGPPTNHCRVL